MIIPLDNDKGMGYNGDMMWNNLLLPDKSYYQDDAVIIYHADCREILPLLPDKSIDLVLTDPPYGINYQSNHRSTKFEKIYGDLEYPTEWLSLVNRLIDKGTIYLFCNEASLDEAKLLLHQNKWSSNRLLIWDKQSTSGGNLDNYASRTEFILYGTKMFAPKLNGSRDGNLISIPRVRPQDLQHPNEKPYLLMAYLIMKSTNPNEIVLDCFMGVGASVKASRDLGRKCIGIEIGEKYCRIAADRCRQMVFDLKV